jgi:dTDP-4-dehydrorhamnose reductase
MIIFGAHGQLGFALSKIFPDAHCYGHTDVDITDAAAVARIFELEKPDIVINAAAYPNAELAELQDTEIAYRVNVLGAITLSRLATTYDATMVYISTDYVFDGTTIDGFVEDDAPCPLNVHGLSKHAGEEAVNAYARKHYIIRTSALFGPKQGSFGNNFVTKRIEQVKKGDTLAVVSDQWTIPTYTFDVAMALRALFDAHIPSGIYHVISSGGATTWFDFTKEIVRCAGLTGTITPLSTEETKSLLNRQRRSILRDTKLHPLGIQLPDWRESLYTYITTYQ